MMGEDVKKFLDNYNILLEYLVKESERALKTDSFGVPLWCYKYKYYEIRYG